MIAVACLVVALWIAYLATLILNLALVPNLRRRNGLTAAAPSVSFIVPARDEERVIEVAVRSLLGQEYPDFEVIVVNDRSTDSTAAILGRIAAADSRLTVGDGDEPPAGWLGKTWAHHQGARRARGERLLFVDADLVYHPEALAAAVEVLDSSGVALVTLFPSLEMQGFWENVIMPGLTMTGFVFMPAWLSNTTTIEILGIGGGTGNLVRRDAYETVGGHETLKAAVVDDVGLARILRRRGLKTLVVRAEELVSLRMYHGVREIIEGFTKNLFIAFGRSFVVTAFICLLSIVAHILPYLFALMGAVHAALGRHVTATEWLAVAAVALITATRIVLFRAVRYPIGYAILAHPLSMLFWLYLYVRSAWITGVRRQVRWRGRTYDAAGTRFSDM
ncbi:MAG TPA: glycosyltransferase family 2 protein [Thermoanaerobaculia bacterium]|nr:glycosyltransferase family 2 protein [Thermoanaerobaculia bacterium]